LRHKTSFRLNLKMTFFLVFLLQVFQFPHQNNNPVLHKCLNFYHFFSLSLSLSLSLNSQARHSLNIIFHLLPLPLSLSLSLSQTHTHTHTHTLCTIPKLFPNKKRKNKSPVLSLPLHSTLSTFLTFFLSS